MSPELNGRALPYGSEIGGLTVSAGFDVKTWNDGLGLRQFGFVSYRDGRQARLVRRNRDIANNAAECTIFVSSEPHAQLETR